MPTADSGLKFAVAFLRIAAADLVPFLLPMRTVKQALAIDKCSLPEACATQKEQ